MADVDFQRRPSTSDERITYFAMTDARNKRVPFGIKAKDRSRHMYVIGKTGMGKSTLLENMAVQDIRSGAGLAFIDPHGSSAEKLLDYIPKERIEDVLYFAPFDLSHPVSFNVMENIDPDKRHLVVNGLMSTFEKIWVDAWSARMAYILQNTLLALLEYPGATLLGVNRMYIDKEYRKKVVEQITDPSVKSFWTEEFTKFTDRYTQEATPAIQNKIGQFASNPLIRNIIGQPQSSFDIRKIMDNRKIMIVNLAKGKLGEGNANLLGSMLITKIYLAAMSRADAPIGVMRNLPDFNLYVDEFQSFANKSFADILSEARKYKLNLIMAHQYVEQMEEEVRAAVFGNVGTTVSFRVGAFDAELLEKEFAPIFTATDMVNLGFAQIYLKLMIDGISSQPFSATTLPPIEEQPINFKEQVVENSRKTYARPRAEVEKEILDWHAPVTPPVQKQEGQKSEKRQQEGQKSERRETQRQQHGERRPERPRPQIEEQPREGGSLEERRYEERWHEERRHEGKKKQVPEPQGKTPEELKRTMQRIVQKAKEGGEQKRGDRGFTKEDRTELRGVLSEILKRAEEKEKPAPTQSAEKKKEPTAVSKTETKEEKVERGPEVREKRKEIPKEELEKLLKVEE